MLGYLDFLFLGYAGRIGRLTYWVSLLVLGALQVGAIYLLLLPSLGDLARLAPHMAAFNDVVTMRVIIPCGIVSVLFLYPTYAVTAKRWHDRNKSGWWSLIALVPVIGGLWYLIELGFLGGDDGANYYGSR